MSWILDRFIDPLKKLEREHKILELKVKNAKLKQELQALKGREE